MTYNERLAEAAAKRKQLPPEYYFWLQVDPKRAEAIRKNTLG